MKIKAIILTSIVLIFILFLGSCKTDDDSPSGGGDTVELKVTSQTSGKVVDIEYDADGMQSTDVNNQTLPWSTNFDADLEAGYDVNLQVGSGSSGNMTAEILINGVVVKSETDDNLIIMLYVHGL